MIYLPTLRGRFLGAVLLLRLRECLQSSFVNINKENALYIELQQLVEKHTTSLRKC